jgi:hypothetical protein
MHHVLTRAAEALRRAGASLRQLSGNLSGHAALSVPGANLSHHPTKKAPQGPRPHSFRKMT